MKNMALYRIEVGSADGIEVRNILGAVANETGLQTRFIGQIRIHQDHSTIEMPGDLPREMLDHLRTVYVGKKQMRISRNRGDAQGVSAAAPDREKKPKKAKTRPSRKPKSTKSKKPKGAGGKGKKAKPIKPKGDS